jgi:5-methylthioribose kinase
MVESPRLDDANLPDYLRGLGLLAQGEVARVEPAGDGNINWVRRVRASRPGLAGDRSFVVKQARPHLERFPEYSAPTERIVCEARYFETVRPLDRDAVCPAVVCFDADARVLVLEDLGDAPRLDAVLASGGDARGVAQRLARFLGAVHAATANDASLTGRFENDAMRRLHGDHIFELPFQPNEFPLPAAVRARAQMIWDDGRLAAIAREAYARYLTPRGALVHGDVQAGNVLVAARGAVLLDAEIAHIGDPAFDLGTLFAHLWLPAVARGVASDADAAIHDAWRSYASTATGADADLHQRAMTYAAIEMLRRTLGAARVAVVVEPVASLRVVDFASALLGLN